MYTFIQMNNQRKLIQLAKAFNNRYLSASLPAVSCAPSNVSLKYLT